MLVSNCCNDLVIIRNTGEVAYFECEKCSRPTDGKFSLDLGKEYKDVDKE